VDESRARRLFAAARVAVLATVRDGRPHLVPVTFAVDADLLYTGVDAKPKRGTRLRRHANIDANPAVSLLAQHVDEEWSRLWWVRVDGRARVSSDPVDVARAVHLLQAKYPQYAEIALGGPIIVAQLQHWQGWHGSG
jgi:PPOX class probable F420-dependent enzyme